MGGLPCGSSAPENEAWKKGVENPASETRMKWTLDEGAKKHV
jgi:hypothetical protein